MKLKLCLLLFAYFGFSNGEIVEKPRLCCKYSEKESSTCPTTTSCSVRQNANNQTIHPKLDACQVMSDSKRDKTSDDACYSWDFMPRSDEKSGKINNSALNELLVTAYLLEDKVSFSNVEIFGLEISIPYGVKWSKARFRINNQGCDNNCSPRCVEIDRKSEEYQHGKDYLLYDCELGLFHTSNKISVPTSGMTYGLDVCLDEACQSYLLTMPKSSLNDSKIILIETYPLIREGDLIMHFPPGFEKHNVSFLLKDFSLCIPLFRWIMNESEIMKNSC